MIEREGQLETFKGAVHLVGFGFAAICLAYNAARWLEDRKTRNAVNVAVYSGALLFEAKNVLHHVESAQHD